MVKDGTESVSEEPTGRRVNCPECYAVNHAIVGKSSELVEREADADGKVRVTCHECDESFLVYYRDEQ